jgi:NADPH:quinone reductase-like Zn-dependent oxidoreductase
VKAIRIEAFGGPEVLKWVEVPVPEPGDGELLVKVQAAGVNPVDYKIRRGGYPAVKEDKLPYTLGRDVAGIVEKVGRGVVGLSIGHAVYGMPGIERGGYAEYAILKQSETARKPVSLEAIDAGAVPLASLTAWQGIFEHGGLKSGQTVLIHGGSGGVGHFAIQFAKAKGARVLTTVSSRHVDFARRLGADEVIDYKKERFEDRAHEVDVIFDLIGGQTQDRSWAVLRKGGTLVSTVREPSQDKARELDARAVRYTARESGAELTEIAGLIDAGRVRSYVAEIYPLREAARAQSRLEAGDVEGKIVLKVDS